MVALSVTTQLLAVTVSLTLVLWVLGQVRGLRRWPRHLTRGMVVVFPPLLQGRGTTTALVWSIPLTWMGMIPFGLFFASYGSSTVWRKLQV